MFSYYGSKSKIVKKYPFPKFDNVIEPFAGSARYALLYWDKKVTIIDSDNVIISVWKYLQKATPEEILSLPDVPNATRLETISGFSDLCQEQKWLIGFCSNGGSASPKNVSGRHNFNSWNKDKKRISENLYKIRHWDIICDSYENIDNKEATWYIDPPYQNKGKYYKQNKVDYEKLGEFCKTRLGQVIVCENDGAVWLPFSPFLEVAFTHFKSSDDYQKRTKEVVWYNE